MVRKFLVLLLIFFVTKVFCCAYAPMLPKGTLIKVYTKIALTTENLEEGSKVYFIAPSDVWVLEEKAIEKGDIFYGHVDMLKVPVQGVNAAISIKIDELQKISNQIIPIKGEIIFSNGTNTLGGTLTNPLTYKTTIHPRKVYGNIWGGALQYVPTGEYEFGKHVVINNRDLIFVKLDEDYYLHNSSNLVQ